ncbi:MAG: hypothetical protein K6T83_12220 [Alicyclobacillus sp.]|nr:hypothetical protein [Alicyclobacillus sp.]
MMGADVDKCEHPECVAKRERWIHQQRQTGKWSDELRELMDHHGYKIKWSDHLDERETLRSIPSWQSKQALENGDCISFSVYQDPKYGLTYKWLWLGYAKVGLGCYRPLHLVLLVNPNNSARKIVVGTVYDPSATPEIWDESYSVRICWKEKQ